MTVLITGGGGFIGSHAAEHFLKNGFDVLIIDNLSRTRLLGKNNAVLNPDFNWKYLKQWKNLKARKIDITKFEKLSEIAKNVEAIIHTAAQVAVTASVRDPRMDFEINALGTFNILELARRMDAPLVFCSTNKVYGENVNKIPVTERNSRFVFSDRKFRNGIAEDFSVDHTSHSPYGCSKLCADMYAQDYAKTYGLRTGVFRMSCIYGERQLGVEDQGWVAWFAIATAYGLPITIYGNGKQVRDVLYVKDLVSAFDLFLRSKIRSDVFNMGGGFQNTLSLLELIDLLRASTKRTPRLTYADWRPSDQRVYISDISKAVRVLKWKPSVSPKEGVRKLTNWIIGRNFSQDSTPTLRASP